MKPVSFLSSLICSVTSFDMKINAIINRYIFAEFIPPFVISLVFFTFIFLMTKILDITNYIVNYKIGFGKIILLLTYYMPYFMTFVIPMSVMMAVLLTFLRMSSDNEIIALKASGVSLYRLLPPVIAFCTMGCVMTGIVIIYGVPWGYVSAKNIVYDMAADNLNVGLKERTFNNNFENVTLYINKVDVKKNLLRDIFIEDQRDDRMISTIIAPRGMLYTDPGTFSAYLQLYEGTINQVNLDRKTINTSIFETYRLTLDVKTGEAGAKEKKSTDEKSFTLKELKAAIHNAEEKNTQYYKYRIELQRKFSIPVACFALGILAMPLGVQSKARRQSYGLGLGLVFFLFYYLLLSMGWVLGKTGYYPPEIGMWMPNLIMGLLAVFCLVKSVSEGDFNIFSAFLKNSKNRN